MDVNSTGQDIPRGDDLTRFVQNWVPEEQCPKMADRGQAMWEIVEALRYFSPETIYAIAKEALVGNFDPFDAEETLCSDQIFLECWKIERTNNGP